MSINGMSVGRDYTFGYFDALTGTIIDLGDVQDVRVTRNQHTIKSMPYNDVPRFGYIVDGYTITFTITRTSQRLEDFQLLLDTRFNDGIINPPGFLNETVSNPDGTVSRYQYTRFVFGVTDLGDVRREAPVRMAAQGMASDKIFIA